MRGEQVSPKMKRPAFYFASWIHNSHLHGNFIAISVDAKRGMKYYSPSLLEWDVWIRLRREETLLLQKCASALLKARGAKYYLRNWRRRKCMRVNNFIREY